MGFEGIVGHEFVGRCVEAPADAAHLIGKRVVGEINVACQSCRVCSHGGDRARNHCPKRSVLGILKRPGTYAQYLSLPARNLHVVPDDVSTTNAAFAEPLAAAFRIREQGLLASDEGRLGDDTLPPKVAVVGDGKLGILIAEVLARSPPTLQKVVGKPEDPAYVVTLVGRHASKMALVTAPNVDKRVSEDVLLAEDGDDASLAAAFDVVVDATGSPAGLDLARRLCRPLGTLVLKSTCAAGTDFNTAPFVIDELRVVGSRCGPFEPALELLRTLDLTPLVSATFPLAEAAAAVRRAGEKGTMKVQIICAEEEPEQQASSSSE
mmetsp:Transcript_1917/g.7382  ORF Transcript_1917/g.7382 Transcript_1917/m.7382 type:complete len:322 (+) Transcript_1917:254-1219(+)